ncbi:small conductance mechanosensitive channel [Paenibacillus phyllosphaerae]|uniref:Small conductance mechanosensitive channel n=1 Tax=Paenibacillus phyllosphaerae TaxID=274593 RepID=A0A7W5B166_9BACL|nr:mechanosensitive ion channel family protein [Paenibacillus phyllosphaerae]MBB3112550.1 small conductance mechanosensitive channel [Paenibacillus phyllosphaerae]
MPQWLDRTLWLDRLHLVGSKVLVIAIILFVTWFILKIRRSVIRRTFELTRLDEKQRATLESLLMSFTRYILYIIAVLMCMGNIGVEIAPIIASAGVVGLAVGFGAQTLVKDLITGFFIIFEDQFSVGDYVSINSGQINGTVTSVGLRATKIRTWAQHVVVIQNSEIKVSQNYNRERMRAIVNVSVPFDTEPAEIEEAVHAVSEELTDTMPYLFLHDAEGKPLEPPQLYGLADLDDNKLGAQYTVTCLVKDVHYWRAGRELRKALAQKFHERGIQLA